MIKLNTIKPNKGIKDQFVVTSNEPSTIEVMVLENGEVIAHVYKGDKVDEYTEPVGAYDSTLDKKPNWEAK